MLIQPHKTSPISTDESWYTPHKHKNVSAIETNPSMNVAQFQSNQYSSIELSQSLAQSPSFLSPNKELGSLLMTPNYSSKQVLPSGSESIGDMRLRTQSLVETSRFYELTARSNKTSQETSSNEVKQLMKMINEIRQAKVKKTYHTRKLNQQMAIQSFLVNELKQKEQSILAHKLVVQEKIQHRTKLQKKLNQKKTRIKAKTKHFLKSIQQKVQQLRQQLDQTCVLLNLDEMVIARYQNQLYHMNHYMQQHGYATKAPYYMYQHQNNEMLESKAEQLNYQNIPGFYSNPSSSRSYGNMKKSSEDILKSGQQKSVDSSNFSIQDLLKHHLSSMIGKGDSEKIRKFSFGQNPSFCMEKFQNKYSGGNKNANNQGYKSQNDNDNPIIQALAMKMHQLASDNTHNNPQSISPQKKFQQNLGPIFPSEFENISPIASSKKVRFTGQIQTELQKKANSIQKNDLSTQKKDFGQIIQQLDHNQEDDPQQEVEYYNESVIDINDDPMVESKHKNSPRLNFNRKTSESPQHKRTLSGQTAKKSLKLPLVLEQSIVKIACESSTVSQYLQGHEFSPRKQQKVENRLRSPTHQVMPAIHEEMHDLRKTDNRLKSSNKEESSKHSGGGAQTPIFRSQASEQQQNIGFSRAFLGGSMKQSQMLQPQANDLEFKKSIDRPRSPLQRSNNQQRAYRTTVLTQSKKSQPYSIYQTQNMRTIERDQNEAIEQKNQQSDDDFYSCTLRTESKVFVQSTIKSRELEDQIGEESQQFKSSNNQGDKIKSSKSRFNNGQRKDLNDKAKDMNLVLENVKNKNYDMSLNLSQLGNKTYENNQKRISAQFSKKGASVQLDRRYNDFSDTSIEKDQRNGSGSMNNQSISTL